MIGELATDRLPSLLDGIIETCRDYDMPVMDRRPTCVELDTGIGTLGFSGMPGGLRVDVRSNSAANLFMLQEAAISRIEAMDPGLVSRIAWSDRLRPGTLPPNFRIGRVVSADEHGPLFRRLHLEADDLAPFARDGLHLRLCLPPQDRDPAWPLVDSAGRTTWPEGEAALHVAVYTIRHVDPASGTMVIDAYRHGRGQSCAWLAEAEVGDTLGLAGPGGGWLPDARHLVLAGDETAVPAISRILETAAPDTTGMAFVEVDRADYFPALAVPRGVELICVERGAGDRLERALEQVDLGPAGSRYVWFAAEKRRATAMRSYLRDNRGVGREESYVAAYWTDK